MVFEKLRKLVTWVSVYDRYGNVLSEPKVRFIKDLETSHIFAIFNYAKETGRVNLPKIVAWTMLKELEYRRTSNETK